MNMKILMWPIEFVMNIYRKIKREITYRKRLKELRKRDPFIYK